MFYICETSAAPWGN